MPAAALALALAAAFVHALWNLLLARARDPEAATAVALLVSVLAFAPAAAASWRVEAEALPYVLGSGALQLAYFALLAAAYERSELSLVYPLARGLAPVLVLATSVAVLGAGASVQQAAGVVVVAVGILLVRGLRRGPSAGVAFGLVIAACIASYTLVDKRGIEHASPIAYLELLMLGPSVAYAAAVAGWKGLPALRAALTPSAVVAGIASFGAYVLVLLALRLAPAAPVAAVREASVVVATALAIPVLRERVGPVRLAGAAAVFGGIALLGLD